MRTVHELTNDELDELREAYLQQIIDSGEEFPNSVNQIPISNIKAHYEGTYFVDDDFFCNQ